jgi:type IV pilus assembly protein PilY1
MNETGTAFSQSVMATAITAFPPAGTMTAAIVSFSPFQKVIVSATSGPGGTDERQNFANWFTYYRVRIAMMKSGLGRAFVGIGSTYRVGFMTIYATPSGSTTDPGYLAINDFVTTPGGQKQTWYTKVYSQTPGGSTPLKVALSTASRNIAGKIGPDPIQYSCQQNFILLSTDGYWNAGTANGTKLDGSTAVGNQDNNSVNTPPPMYDGGLAGSVNTLADVAAYYYNTDLRPGSGPCNTGVAGADVCQDNVPISGLDIAPWQHVTLFTLGLGTNGQLVLPPPDPNHPGGYLQGTSADYNAILGGSKNWPVPVGDTLTTIDDLWHAAVNGHGQYFSAKNPDLLVSGLQTALASVTAHLAAGAAAATSNLEPVAGDNFAFVASYTTEEWTGEIQSRSIDLTSGVISTTSNWSAQGLLDAATSTVTDSRTIFTFLSGSKTNFLPASFSAAQKTAWFTPGNAPVLSQYSGWNVAQVANGTPDTVINYLRGQTGFQENSAVAVNQLYRVRSHILGDIIDGKPVYVRLPPFNYSDNNYAAFKTSATVTARPGTVYVGANDGMLHAFDSATGTEDWAYIPSFVLPNLKALAGDNYPTAHQYYVDGSPVVGDVWTGSAWRTILVGGLNAGGKGYYALDITDPTTPTVLWEYSDANLGFSYSNPVIGKLADGTWTVMFSSGYNNVGDGVGRLYVLNAYTGVLKFTVSTGVGSALTPSGLGKIAAWVDNGLLDNTIQRVYSGDTLGNLWRFDVNNIIPPAGIEATQLAFFQTTGPTYNQPITTQPELGLVSNKPVIYVGTGRYLGATDLTDLGQQSLYAIVDNLTATGLGNARTETTCPLVQQSLTVINVNTRSTSTLPVNLASKCGWFLDFNPVGGNTPGERVSVDPKLQLGVLAVATNIPEVSVCSVGGTSFLYFFDYTTGQFVSTSVGAVAGQRIGNAIAVGINTYQLPGGKVVTTVTTSDDQHPVFGNPSNLLAGPVGRRVGWRELLN